MSSPPALPWIDKVPYLMRPVHRFFYPLVTSSSSNMIVVNWQSMCGIVVDHSDNSKKKKSPKKTDNNMNDSKHEDSNNYKIHNYVLYLFFRLMSMLGEEIYFVLSVFMWFTLPVAIPFATAMGFVCTLGQWIKDISHLPRPPPSFIHNKRHYRIAKLEKHFETEYGMPSTHTMSGGLMYTVLYACQRQGYFFTPDDDMKIWILGFLITLCTGLSRLYIGVHSIYDVMVGLVITLIVQFTLLIPYADAIDAFIYHHPYGPLVPLMALIWFIKFYPKTRPWSASWGTAALLFGVWEGLAIGLWISFTQYPELSRVLMEASLLDKDLFALDYFNFSSKLILGGIVAGVTKLGSKELVQSLCLWLYSIKGFYIHEDEFKDVNGNTVPLEKAYSVELPTRLTSYMLTAFATVVVVPWCWIACGIA